jgi:cytochrome c oxidase subunit II
VSRARSLARERNGSPCTGTVGAVPRHNRRVAVVVAGVAATAVLAGCADNAPQDTWQPRGDNAQTIHDLQWPVFAIAGVVLLIVASAVTWCIYRYRDRGQPIPKQTHGRPALEIGLTILPAMILIGVAIPTVGTIMALAETDDTECVVNITGQQWWWEIDYPAQEGCGGITQPIVTSGQLVIPVETNVLMRGTSRDVIHSFWVPRINGKRDVVPGRIQTLRLEANQPGIYAGQCAEFCGLSHANMRMEIVALTAEDFETWKANQLAEYEAPQAGTEAAAGEAVFVQQCARCHQVNGLIGSDGQPVIAHPEDNVYAGAAPNLTHLMSRNTFAGATFDLLTPSRREVVWDAPPEEFGSLYLEGVTAEYLNAPELREWIRDAPAKKPMYTDPEELGPTNGLPRGMPDLGLSEDQIDVLIAYLLERN